VWTFGVCNGAGYDDCRLNDLGADALSGGRPSYLWPSLKRYSQAVTKAPRIVGNTDVRAKTARKRTENTGPKAVAGAVVGWSTNHRTVQFRPIEDHTSLVFQQFDMNATTSGLIGRRI